jgi:acyl-CoA reductase-like NAD-dependent aldehyde dehydrogenase
MSVEAITTISPITNEPILKRNGVSAAELEAMPELAVEAFKKFRQTTLAERKEIIEKALKVLQSQKQKLTHDLTEQMGRPCSAAESEITTAIKRSEYLMKISEGALKDTDGEAEKGFKRYIRKVPVGPVLIIFAWNVSLHLLHLTVYLTMVVPLSDLSQRINTCSVGW